MQITIEIEPQKLEIFLEKIKNVEGFLNVKTPLEKQLSPKEKIIWDKIKIGLDEIKSIEKGTKKGKTLSKLLEELKEN